MWAAVFVESTRFRIGIARRPRPRGSRIKVWEVSKLASDKRIKVTLACSECKQRNYNTMKNKKNDPDRLEMNKYCRFCKKHTSHKETR